MLRARYPSFSTIEATVTSLVGVEAVEPSCVGVSPTEAARASKLVGHLGDEGGRRSRPARARRCPVRAAPRASACRAAGRASATTPLRTSAQEAAPRTRVPWHAAPGPGRSRGTVSAGRHRRPPIAFGPLESTPRTVGERRRRRASRTTPAATFGVPVTSRSRRNANVEPMIPLAAIALGDLADRLALGHLEDRGRPEPPIGYASRRTTRRGDTRSTASDEQPRRAATSRRRRAATSALAAAR